MLLEEEQRFPWLDISEYPLILNQNENYFLSNNGSFVMGYKVDSPEIYTLAQEDFESINELWTRALKNLPSGTIVHKQDSYFEKEFDTKVLP
jgi:conjugal transfer ATP-binding protein TraC